MRKVLIFLAIFAGNSLLYAVNLFDTLLYKAKPILYYLSVGTCIIGAISSIHRLWKAKNSIKTGYKVLISVGISVLSVICIPLVFYIYYFLLLSIVYLIIILIIVINYIFDLVKKI
jgi:hypothetical protein